MSDPFIENTPPNDAIQLVADVTILEACLSAGVGSCAPSRTFEFYQETLRFSEAPGDSVTVKVEYDSEVQKAIENRIDDFWEIFERLITAEEFGYLRTQIDALDELLENKVFTALYNFFIKGDAPKNPLKFDEWIADALGENKARQYCQKVREYYLANKGRFQ